VQKYFGAAIAPILRTAHHRAGAGWYMQSILKNKHWSKAPAVSLAFGHHHMFGSGRKMEII